MTLAKALSAVDGAIKDSAKARPDPLPNDHDLEKNFNEADDFGPALPTHLDSVTQSISDNSKHPGPSIPTLTDLRERDERLAESHAAEQNSTLLDLRNQRRSERKIRAERLEELIPRAAPGTRDRQIEKRREANYANRAFAASAHDSSTMDLPDRDVMGEEDELGQLKRMKAESERKKNEREIRREEALRARKAERNERMKVMREKEEKTMKMLEEIARARFGSSSTNMQVPENA